MSRSGVPSVFVGSSSQSYHRAEAVRHELVEGPVEVQLWKHIFDRPENFLDILMKAVNDFDFAAFVFDKDDLVTQPDGSTLHDAEGVVDVSSYQFVPRDNVVFEAGLFMGALGKERVFILKHKESRLLSDLSGHFVYTYESEAQFRDRCTAIRNYILTYESVKWALPFDAQKKIVRGIPILPGGILDFERIFAGKVVKNRSENYAIAEMMLRRACDNGFTVFEASNSENEVDYENMWEDLLGKLDSFSGRAYRLFYAKDKSCEQRYRQLAKREGGGWFIPLQTDWMMDVMLLVNNCQEAEEALIGLSSLDPDTWMAIHTKDLDVVRTIHTYAISALTLARQRAVAG